MPTPENKVKNECKKIIDKYGAKIDGFWPVPAGYGESHLDFVGCAAGYFISIETKKPGGKPTPRQKHRISCVRRAGGLALLIDGTDATTTYAELDDLLYNLTKDFQV